MAVRFQAAKVKDGLRESAADPAIQFEAQSLAEKKLDHEEFHFAVLCTVPFLQKPRI